MIYFLAKLSKTQKKITLHAHDLKVYIYYRKQKQLLYCFTSFKQFQP